MKALIDFSRKYGADKSLVLAGGGNTSMKENGILHVKCSGCALVDITEDNFVALDMKALFGIINKQYPLDDGEREAAFLHDVMAARKPGEESKRPSVEALLHALFAQRYSAIVESVKKTGRVVLVSDACQRGSFLNDVAQNISELGMNAMAAI